MFCPKFNRVFYSVVQMETRLTSTESVIQNLTSMVESLQRQGTFRKHSRA